MKIQGILNPAVVPEPGRPLPAERKAVDPPKVKKETASPVAPSAPPRPDYSEELERIAEAIRKYIQVHPTSVDITVDEELQQIVTRVIEEDSGKVIRQYPEDAALAVMKHLKELRGLLVNRRG